MRYLIIINNKPFLTEWFQYPSHYAEGMIVFDLTKELYTTNGINWIEIERDHL